MATGHYAQIKKYSDGNFELLENPDPTKGQSVIFFMDTWSRRALTHTFSDREIPQIGS